MRTYVYIDGFNFYYGALVNTPYKWLDFMALFKKVLAPHHQVLRIRYFTALVSAPTGDPDKPIRQKTLIRALRSYIPELEVHHGFFLTSIKKAPLARTQGRTKDLIIKTEEKGSDVNMAVHLIRDAWLNAYDCAVVVTNDSDLSEALKVVKCDFGKRIGLVTPGKKRTSRELAVHADFIRSIRNSALASSQLPDPIPGTSIHKPKAW